jgi:hypothetical protein
MCATYFGPILADDLLRLVLSLALWICCILLSYIFTHKKAWDIPFWLTFVGFLSAIAGYGYLVDRIYSQNTFSYDGFISSAAIISTLGLLFSNHGRYVEFSSRVFSKNGPIFFATFIVFSLIYLSTVDYDFQCVPSKYQFFIDILQIVVYPLLLLFAISAFLYRLAICLSAFAIFMALFLIENVFFIFHELVIVKEYNVLVEEIIYATISIFISMVAIYILTKTKRIYKEK